MRQGAGTDVEPATKIVDLQPYLSKRSCPVCSLLKDYQAWLTEGSELPQASGLCNFHVWALAKSSPARFATKVFLATLRRYGQDRAGNASPSCEFCNRIRLREIAGLQGLAQLLGRSNFSDWIRDYAVLCIPHGKELQNYLPPSEQKIVTQILERNDSELESELEALLPGRGGQRIGGGGVLGRAAEFLVCQRGVISREKPEGDGKP